jgi:hypothetical protein
LVASVVSVSFEGSVVTLDFAIGIAAGELRSLSSSPLAIESIEIAPPFKLLTGIALLGSRGGFCF